MSFYLFVMFGLWDIFLRTSIRLKSFFGSMNRGRMKRCYFNSGNNPVLFLKSNLESKNIIFDIIFDIRLRIFQMAFCRRNIKNYSV